MIWSWSSNTDCAAAYLSRAGIGAAMFRKLIGACVGLAMMVMAGTANAVPINLLTNPGFETGNFSGWTAGGNSSNFGVATDGTNIAGTAFPSIVNVRSGLFSAFASVAQFSPSEVFTLSQTISVLASETYSIGYFAGIDSPNSGFGFGNVLAGSVDIFIDNISIGATHPNIISSGPNPSDFDLVSVNFTTGPAQTFLNVRYSAAASGITVGLSLDDFFFIGEAPVAEIPEPSTLALFATALALLAFFGWRRRGAVQVKAA